MRRLGGAAGFAIAATLACACPAAQAQKVLNPTSSLSVTATALTFGMHSGSASIDGTAADLSVPMFTGASVGPDGAITVPNAGMAFPAISVPDQSGSCGPFNCTVSGITIQLVPVGDATGHVNPFTGAADLSAEVYANLGATACATGLPCQTTGASCRLGSSGSPIALSMTTGTTAAPLSSAYGPITGRRYEESGGTLQLVGDTLVVPAATGCFSGVYALAEQALNSALGFPNTPGNVKLAVSARLDPILHRGVIAGLSPSTTSGMAPLTVGFDASGTEAPAGISSYAFDFNGDGVADQTGSSPTGTFTYTTPGTYTVRLTATDPGGDTDSVTRTITVLPQPPRAPPGGPLALPTVIRSGGATVLAHGYTFTISDGQVVGCPDGGQACNANVNATTKGASGKALEARGSRQSQLQVGHATLLVAAGATMPVRFQLNQAGATLLRKQHRLRITVAVTVRAGATGTPQTFVKTLTITWHKPRR